MLRTKRKKIVTEDPEHLFWECEEYEEARKPYTEALNQLVKRAKKWKAEWGEKLEAILATKTFRSCMLVPETPEHQQSLFDVMPNDYIGVPHEITQGQGEIRNGKGALVVWGDGSATNPTDWRFRRGGWAVFVAQGHPYNTQGPVGTLDQTSARAELRAAAEAIVRIQEDIHIICDCEAVVNGITDILQGCNRKRTTDQDLWDTIRETVRLDTKKITIEWIKSHMTNKEKEEAERKGKWTAEYARRNDEVDVRARKEAENNQPADAKAAEWWYLHKATVLAVQMAVTTWNVYVGEGRAYTTQKDKQREEQKKTEKKKRVV